MSRGKYKKWEPSDIMILKRWVKSGLTNKEIGKAMDRSPLSIARAVSHFRLCRTYKQRMDNIIRSQAGIDRKGPKNGNWRGGISGTKKDRG